MSRFADIITRETRPENFYLKDEVTGHFNVRQRDSSPHHNGFPAMRRRSARGDSDLVIKTDYMEVWDAGELVARARLIGEVWNPVTKEWASRNFSFAAADFIKPDATTHRAVIKTSVGIFGIQMSRTRSSSKLTFYLDVPNRKVRLRWLVQVRPNDNNVFHHADDYAGAKTGPTLISTTDEWETSEYVFEPTGHECDRLDTRTPAQRFADGAGLVVDPSLDVLVESDHFRFYLLHTSSPNDYHKWIISDSTTQVEQLYGGGGSAVTSRGGWAGWLDQGAIHYAGYDTSRTTEILESTVDRFMFRVHGKFYKTADTDPLQDTGSNDVTYDLLVTVTHATISYELTLNITAGESITLDNSTYNRFFEMRGSGTPAARRMLDSTTATAMSGGAGTAGYDVGYIQHASGENDACLDTVVIVDSDNTDLTMAWDTTTDGFAVETQTGSTTVLTGPQDLRVTMVFYPRNYLSDAAARSIAETHFNPTGITIDAGTGRGSEFFQPAAANTSGHWLLDHSLAVEPESVDDPRVKLTIDRTRRYLTARLVDYPLFTGGSLTDPLNAVVGIFKLDDNAATTTLLDAMGGTSGLLYGGHTEDSTTTDAVFRNRGLALASANSDYMRFPWAGRSRTGTVAGYITPAWNYDTATVSDLLTVAVIYNSSTDWIRLGYDTSTDKFVVRVKSGATETDHAVTSAYTADTLLQTLHPFLLSWDRDRKVVFADIAGQRTYFYDSSIVATDGDDYVYCGYGAVATFDHIKLLDKMWLPFGGVWMGNGPDATDNDAMDPNLRFYWAGTGNIWWSATGSNLASDTWDTTVGSPAADTTHTLFNSDGSTSFDGGTSEYYSEIASVTSVGHGVKIVCHLWWDGTVDGQQFFDVGLDSDNYVIGQLDKTYERVMINLKYSSTAATFYSPVNSLIANAWNIIEVFAPDAAYGKAGFCSVNGKAGASVLISGAGKTAFISHVKVGNITGTSSGSFSIGALFVFEDGWTAPVPMLDGVTPMQPKEWLNGTEKVNNSTFWISHTTNLDTVIAIKAGLLASDEVLFDLADYRRYETDPADSEIDLAADGVEQVRHTSQTPADSKVVLSADEVDWIISSITIEPDNAVIKLTSPSPAASKWTPHTPDSSVIKLTVDSPVTILKTVIRPDDAVIGTTAGEAVITVTYRGFGTMEIHRSDTNESWVFTVSDNAKVGFTVTADSIDFSPTADVYHLEDLLPAPATALPNPTFLITANALIDFSVAALPNKDTQKWQDQFTMTSLMQR